MVLDISCLCESAGLVNCFNELLHVRRVNGRILKVRARYENIISKYPASFIQLQLFGRVTSHHTRDAFGIPDN